VRDVKTKILHALASIAAISSAVAGLNLIGIASFLPPKIAAVVTIIPTVAAAVAHGALAMGDKADDGQVNGSFKSRCHPVAFLAALVIALGMSSCVTTVGPNGEKTTKPDHEETSYWGDLVRDVLHDLIAEPAPSQPPAVPVTPAK